jgi:acyl carrier protein
VTRQRIRSFLDGFLADASYRDDDDILGTGIVTSMFAMDLVTFIEEDFGIAVENDDLDPDNFRSIDAMVRLVESKLAAAGGGPALAASAAQ